MSTHAVAAEAESIALNKTKLAMLLFIGSESIFFACLIAAYVYYTGASPTGPNAHSVLDPLKTGFYTACLLSSSATIYMAERCVKRGRNAASAWVAATIFLGLVFLYGEMQEYRKLLHENVTVSRNLFGSTYYTLTGFHALHVSVGLVLLSIMLILSLQRRFTESQKSAFEGIAYYWHFVDVVWVAVFSTVYLWSTHT